MSIQHSALTDGLQIGMSEGDYFLSQTKNGVIKSMFLTDEEMKAIVRVAMRNGLVRMVNKENGQ